MDRLTEALTAFRNAREVFVEEARQVHLDAAFQAKIAELEAIIARGHVPEED